MAFLIVAMAMNTIYRYSEISEQSKKDENQLRQLITMILVTKAPHIVIMQIDWHYH